MANTPISQLPNLSLAALAQNDLLLAVDVNDNTSPTGTTKNLLIGDLSTYITASGSLFSSSKQVVLSSASGILPISNGGTGTSSFSTSSVLITNAAGNISSISGLVGQALTIGSNGLPVFNSSLISGSSQIDFRYISNKPTLISSSLQLPNFVVYADNWDATLNNPTLPSANIVPGYYYSVTKSGVYNNIPFSAGDSIVSNGITWNKFSGNTSVTYASSWSAATNTPTLPSPSTVAGWYYNVTTAGTYNSVYYSVGDIVLSNGSTWLHIIGSPSISTGISYPSNTQIPWYKSNADGSPNGLYTYFSGSWVMPHPTPANTQVNIFYTGSLTSLATYDGGEGTYIVNGDGSISSSIAITSTTGPMWKVNPVLQGKFALGVSNTNSSTTGDTFVLGQIGGEINHTLSSNEQGAIQYKGDTVDVATGGDAGVSDFYINGGPGAGRGSGGVSFTIPALASANGHNNMPPYYTGYWITRTARQYYRG